jgi:hypothetical protein
MARAWSKDIVLDAGTFGGTKACHVLAEMMNQNIIPVYEKHRVLSFINSAIYDFNYVATIIENGVRIKAMLMMKEHYLNRVNQMMYPVRFLTFLKNVITHHSRRALKHRIIRDELDNRLRLRRVT